MKYFALYKDNGNLMTFGTTSAQIVVGEITADEYTTLKAAQTAKLEYAQQVFSGEITIDDVPEEYREVVAAMVEAMHSQSEEPEAPELMSDIDEALAILSGEVSE